MEILTYEYDEYETCLETWSGECRLGRFFGNDHRPWSKERTMPILGIVKKRNNPVIQYGDALIKLNRKNDRMHFASSAKYPFLAPIFINTNGFFSSHLSTSPDQPRPLDPIVQVGYVVQGDVKGAMMDDISIYYHLRDVPKHLIDPSIYDKVHSISPFKMP
jgi:hypothetical protein